MFFSSFTTKRSVNEVLSSIEENVVKSVNRNWGIDCFVGKVHKKGFRIYHHKAYMKNSFNKTAYGRVWEKENETQVFYLLISPFLSWRVYVTILLLISILNYDSFNSIDYFSRVANGFRAIASVPFFIGLMSQLIPAPYKKERIDEMITKSISNEPVENNA